MAFRGHFEHSLDAKNRLSIPARFRAAFSTGTVLAKDFEPCVAVWTAETHETIVDRALGALNPMSTDYRRLARYFQGNSFDTELDASGRVILPAQLLPHTGHREGGRRRRRGGPPRGLGERALGASSRRPSMPRSGR